MNNNWLKIKISNFSNEQLKNLYRENYKVSNTKKPYYAKKTDLLKDLFNMSDHKYWLDQYHEIKFELETEMHYRILNNIF